MNKATPASQQSKEIRIEDQAKRYRVLFNGETVADSVRTKLLFEAPYHPVIYFPLEDLRREFLAETQHATHCPWKGDASYWSLKVAGKSAENAVWSYRTPLPQCSAIANHASFIWKSVDGWLEEDSPLLGHARNPYTRIDTLRSSRRVVVRAQGEALADSSHAVFLFETGLPARYYIPLVDCRMDLLTKSDSWTVCPYKGRAAYYSARLPGGEVKDIAWYYPEPWPEVALIRDHIAFYPERVDSIEVADR